MLDVRGIDWVLQGFSLAVPFHTAPKEQAIISPATTERLRSVFEISQTKKHHKAGCRGTQGVELAALKNTIRDDKRQNDSYSIN